MYNDSQRDSTGRTSATAVTPGTLGKNNKRGQGKQTTTLFQVETTFILWIRNFSPSDPMEGRGAREWAGKISGKLGRIIFLLQSIPVARSDNVTEAVEMFFFAFPILNASMISRPSRRWCQPIICLRSKQGSDPTQVWGGVHPLLHAFPEFVGMSFFARPL